MKITLHQSYLDRDSVNQTLRTNFLAIEIVTIVNHIMHHYNVCYQPFWLHYIIPYSHQLDPKVVAFNDNLLVRYLFHMTTGHWIMKGKCLYANMFEKQGSFANHSFRHTSSSNAFHHCRSPYEITHRQYTLSVNSRSNVIKKLNLHSRAYKIT